MNCNNIQLEGERLINANQLKEIFKAYKNSLHFSDKRLKNIETIIDECPTAYDRKNVIDQIHKKAIRVSTVDNHKYLKAVGTHCLEEIVLQGGNDYISYDKDGYNRE